MRSRWQSLLVGCATVAAIGGCGASRLDQRASKTHEGARVIGVESNMLPADYAGSESCADCHASIYRAWRVSPMHRMTRSAGTAEVKAPFDGGEFRFKEDVAHLSKDGDQRFVELRSKAEGEHVYRVTRIIGGRYREDYAGVEVAAPRANAPAIGDPRREWILPLSFVYATGSFRLKGYSVMSTERPGMRAGAVWNKTCVFCHNTSPYLWSVLGALMGPRAPGYQGEVVDRSLPPERRSSFVVTDEAALARELEETIRRFRAAPPDESNTSLRTLESAAITTIRDRLTGDDLLEIGIGCESCHGGCREHVDEYSVRPSLLPRSRFVEERAPAAKANDRVRAINRVCARCHQVLFSHYPYTWEGGNRRRDPGGSHISSGEARDYLLGGCASAMACTTCHDPHALDRRESLARLSTIEGNELCIRCHERYRGETALRAHAHHDPRGEGAVCINCHMPKKNMALGYGLSRYHRIGSPTDVARVEGDRPLECALCHADKSVGAIVSDMERWWGKRYRREALLRLYGDLGANALEATLARGKPHEQAVAMEVLGEHRVREAAPALAGALTHPYPLVRYYAERALVRIAGPACAIDLDRENGSIAADAKRCLERLSPGVNAPSIAAPPNAPPTERPREGADEDLD